MDNILDFFIDQTVQLGKTFGLNFQRSELNNLDLGSENYKVFEISYFGHASGYFRLVLPLETFAIYEDFLSNEEANKAHSLLGELLNLAISSCVDEFDEFKDTTIGVPRSFNTPIYEPEVVTHEATLFDVNTQSNINIFLHHDCRKTGLSRVLDEQVKETQSISLIARKLEEEKLTMSNQKFEAIGQLAAGVAHEINTPIQFVSDNINFLRESFKKFIEASESSKKEDLSFYKDEIPAALEESREGLFRIAEIVKSLKEFSHPGNDQIQKYSVKTLIDNCISLTKNEWKYVAEIKADIEDVQVNMFPSEMSQVFVNMIVNAAHSIKDKFDNQKKGEISISFSSKDGEHTFEMRDNGGGIPTEYLDKIFNPFFTTKEIGKGTGQGLAISKKIIEDKHSGSIEVLSNSSDGVCFRITIREPANE